MSRRTAHLPMTHVHHGPHTLEGDIEPILAQLRSAPPTLYQCSSTATPLPNTAGPAIPTASDPDRFCSPAEMQERLELTQRWVRELHNIGIRWVIPYTCNVKLGGKPEGRKGAWRFFDHWDDYAFLGIGPRPEAEPIDWMARERDGELHYSYEKLHTAFTCCGWYKYTPCLNNPYFNAYQRANVHTIALSGYDGVFVDNNNINCYCQFCEGLFRGWMRQRHALEQLRELFGWATYDEVHLGWRGNHMDWVKYDPLFRRFIAETLPSDEKIRWFETDDMTKVKLAEAGSGWLWGRSNEFLSWVYVHVPADERKAVWGVERIEGSWGVRDDRDRLLWAETSRFWASSVCDNLRKIKEWGSEVEGKDFLVVPNWGELLTNQELAFRQDMGHDVEEWAPASDIIFWEDNRDPGRMTEGVFFDYSLEYKLAHANGVRSAAMAALPGDYNTCALAHAEATAHGAAFIQRGPEFPDLRAAHTNLLAENKSWFQGYVSAARVGLVMSFQTYRLGNVEHIHETLRLCQFLNDQQVPFDIIVDTQLPHSELLESYSVLFCSGVSSLPAASVAALNVFVASGGTLVVCGEIGATDEFGRKREPVFGGDATANVVRFPSLADALPPGQISREDAIEMVTGIWRWLTPQPTKYPMVNAGDYAVKIERLCDAGLIAGTVPNWSSYRSADPFAANGIRVVPYVKTDGDEAEMSIHVVNYNVDLAQPAGTRAVRVLDNLTLSAPVPHGFVPVGAMYLTTTSEPQELPLGPVGDTIAFTLPKAEIYTLVHVICQRVT